jgi:hypothetical protein
MGMGFWGRRSSVGHPWRPRYHGRQEARVARRVHRRRTPLEVHITFEPSRVSPACVTQAYEQVVPVTRRRTPQERSPRQALSFRPARVNLDF